MIVHDGFVVPLNAVVGAFGGSELNLGRPLIRAGDGFRNSRDRDLGGFHSNMEFRCEGLGARNRGRFTPEGRRSGSFCSIPLGKSFSRDATDCSLSAGYSHSGCRVPP
jgi:hypothetical protein